jgi:inosine-uridine nucleoside N-ribohydrolase
MKTPLIIETDIGRDPDDLFSLLYLITCDKWDIKAVCITPGDWDQVCLVEFVKQCCVADFEIGVPTKAFSRDKTSSGGVHYALMNKYRWPITKLEGLAKPGHEVIKELITDETEFFSIGPNTNLKEYIEANDIFTLPNQITVQGGFCPYSMYRPPVTLDKFENQTFVPTFNFNGDRPGAKRVVQTFRNARFVGKNVCHTMEFAPDRVPDRSERTETCEVKHNILPYRARWLFEDAAALYFKKHKSKKFHDPLAAVCMTHPQIGTWVKGQPVYEKGKWSTTLETKPQDNQNVLVDVKRDEFWKHIKELT